MTPEVRRNATKPRVKGWYIEVHGQQPHEGHRTLRDDKEPPHRRKVFHDGRRLCPLLIRHTQIPTGDISLCDNLEIQI